MGREEDLPVAAPLAWHHIPRPFNHCSLGQRVRAALPDKLQGGGSTATRYLMTVTLSHVVMRPASATPSIDTIGYDFVTYLLCFREFVM